MIVLDASAAVEWLLRSTHGEEVADRLLADGVSVHVPHLWLVEITEVLRRFVAAGALGPDRARIALDAATDLRAVRHPHEPLAPRIWQLRHNLTAYDAAYVALAEALEAELLTTDERLASAPGHAASVVLLGA